MLKYCRSNRNCWVRNRLKYLLAWVRGIYFRPNIEDFRCVLRCWKQKWCRMYFGAVLYCWYRQFLPDNPWIKPIRPHNRTHRCPRSCNISRLHAEILLLHTQRPEAAPCSSASWWCLAEDGFVVIQIFVYTKDFWNILGRRIFWISSRGLPVYVSEFQFDLNLDCPEDAGLSALCHCQAVLRIYLLVWLYD